MISRHQTPGSGSAESKPCHVRAIITDQPSASPPQSGRDRHIIAARLYRVAQARRKVKGRSRNDMPCQKPLFNPLFFAPSPNGRHFVPYWCVKWFWLSDTLKGFPHLKQAPCIHKVGTIPRAALVSKLNNLLNAFPWAPLRGRWWTRVLTCASRRDHHPHLLSFKVTFEFTCCFWLTVE